MLGEVHCRNGIEMVTLIQVAARAVEEAKPDLKTVLVLISGEFQTETHTVPRYQMKSLVVTEKFCSCVLGQIVEHHQHGEDPIDLDVDCHN